MFVCLAVIFVLILEFKSFLANLAIVLSKIHQWLTEWEHLREFFRFFVINYFDWWRCRQRNGRIVLSLHLFFHLTHSVTSSIVKFFLAAIKIPNLRFFNITIIIRIFLIIWSWDWDSSILFPSQHFNNLFVIEALKLPVCVHCDELHGFSLISKRIGK